MQVGGREPTPRLVAESIGQSFSGIRVLGGVAGENGAGKPTLVKILSGVHSVWIGMQS